MDYIHNSMDLYESYMWLLESSQEEFHRQSKGNFGRMHREFYKDATWILYRMRRNLSGNYTDSRGMHQGSHQDSIGKTIGIQQGFYKQRYSDSCGFHGDYMKISNWIPKGCYKDSMLTLRDSVRNTTRIPPGFYQDSIESSMGCGKVP